MTTEKKTTRRRKKKTANTAETEQKQAEETTAEQSADDSSAKSSSDQAKQDETKTVAEAETQPKSKRRSRSRRSRKKTTAKEDTPQNQQQEDTEENGREAAEEADDQSEEWIEEESQAHAEKAEKQDKPQQESRPRPAISSQKSRDDRDNRDDSSSKKSTKTPSREMIVNMAQEQECRIAVLENGRLEELYTERAGSTTHVGNIYKGVVTNVEPSIQACFIDFGIGQNGFLHISDLQSTFFPDSNSSPKERVGRKRPRRERPPIQECLKRGQELIVQVIKEGIGTKGPTLTNYLSIPGRFLVLMPGMNRMGISRKIEDESARAKAREILQQLKPPKEAGFIIRTAGVGRTKRELQTDMNYLLRLWDTVSNKIKSDPAPAAIYKESDLVIRTVRDVFNSNITRIVCDTESTVKKIRDFLSIAMPRTKCRVNTHEGETPIFTKYHIEEEIERIYSRHVPLKIGGSIVIDQTEAIVAIDVNSGKYRVHEDAESTSFKINMEAAPEIARQLRLRDLGGVIIMDFIDMLQEKHRRAVEKALRDAVSTDRARTKILRTSQFGIIEMTRQRMRPSLKRSTFMDCPHCKGSGLMKTPESMTIEVMRQIQSCASKQRIATICVSVAPDVALHLLNENREALNSIEQKYHKRITIFADRNLTNDEVNFSNQDERGSVIPFRE